MVLEAVLANVFHQLLQVIDLGDCDTSIHAVGVVSDFALTKISLDDALGVVGRDAEESEGTFADLGIDGAEGVDFAQRATQYAERAKLQVAIAYKLLGEVALMGTDALVAVLGEVVIPVE